ncbi:MAG: 3D domain-containing protein [Blastocatellia bacterium]
MKNLVRGGIILSILSLAVVFIYAQTRTEYVPVIANDSQLQFNNFNNKSELENNAVEEQNKEQGQDKKKLVEKTGSSKAVSKGSFTATAYCLRGRTAMGHGVRRGIIAADPRVLRLGSRINLAAGAYSGQYLVSDTGGKIKGRRLDIWMSSCSEARRFGRRTVTVSAL